VCSEETIEALRVVRQTHSTICVDMLFHRLQSVSMSGDLVLEHGRCSLCVFRSDKQTLERDETRRPVGQHNPQSQADPLSTSKVTTGWSTAPMGESQPPGQPDHLRVVCCSSAWQLSLCPAEGSWAAGAGRGLHRARGPEEAPKNSTSTVGATSALAVALVARASSSPVLWSRARARHLIDGGASLRTNGRALAERLALAAT
jgi:hypothetical protein